MRNDMSKWVPVYLEGLLLAAFRLGGIRKRKDVQKIYVSNFRIHRNTVRLSINTMQYLTPLISVWISFPVPAIIGVY